MAIIIASPTAASAAATVIMKKTKIWPSIEFSCRENVINARFTAFSINSIHIKITMAFLLIKTPTAPIENRMPDNIKYQVNGIIIPFNPQ